MRLEPRGSHGSHTPNRGVAEAVATLPRAFGAPSSSAWPSVVDFSFAGPLFNFFFFFCGAHLGDKHIEAVRTPLEGPLAPRTQLLTTLPSLFPL